MVGEDGGKVSMNQLPGHGMSTRNDPTYDPYTIGAKHGLVIGGGRSQTLMGTTLAKITEYRKWEQRLAILSWSLLLLWKWGSKKSQQSC